MPLFEAQPSTPSTYQKSQRDAKTQKFRLEIRRRHREDRFRAVRKQVSQSLRLWQFLEELKAERDNLVSKKIHWVVQGLKNGLNTASFYQDIADLQLEPYFCQLLTDSSIEFALKVELMHSLVEFTYFMSKPPAEIFENNTLFDFLRETLKTANLEDPQQQFFAYYCYCFIMNLAGFNNTEFRYFLAESDLLTVMHSLVSQSNPSQKYHRNSVELRQVLVRIYNQLVLLSTSWEDYRFVFKVFTEILSDGRYWATTTLCELSVGCLVSCMGFEGFFGDYCVKTQNNLMGGVEYHMVQVLNLVFQQEFSPKFFQGVVQILINMFDQNLDTQEYVNSFLKSTNNDYYLLQGLRQLKNHPQTKKIIMKTLKLASKATMNLSHFLYADSMGQQQVIATTLDKHLLTNPKYGHYCVQLLSKLLQQDKACLDKLIDHGIMDAMSDLLSCGHFTEEKIYIIDLAENLIEAEEQMRESKEGSNRMVAVMQERGIVKEIELLQEHADRGVYRKAEGFVSRVGAKG